LQRLRKIVYTNYNLYIFEKNNMLAQATTTPTPIDELMSAFNLELLEQKVLDANMAWPQPAYVSVTIRNEESGQTIYAELYKDADDSYSLPIAYQEERTFITNSLNYLSLVGSTDAEFIFSVQLV